MKVCIIGNGISGISAARYIRKLSNHEVTVISSESKHFFSRTALMYIYMGHMKFEHTKPYEDDFWSKNKIELLHDHVISIDFNNSVILLKEHDLIHYDKLILATGSRTNFYGWPGQELNNVSGLYSLQDLQTIEKLSANLKQAIIVGGGLIGIELAEMFRSRNIPVCFLVRESGFWNIVLPREESEMIDAHILEHGIDLRLTTELKEIHDDGNGNCGAVTTSLGETIECGFVGITAGVSPNIEFLKNAEIDINRGIIVNEYLETSINNVYAIGDCAEIKTPGPGRKPVEAVWYTGRIMGETAAYNICGYPVSYDPGIWFNSAKFFDIEYQVYGDVPVNLPSDKLDSVFWKHKNGKQCIRIVFDKDSTAVKGFNFLGLRFRQEVCFKWIKDGTRLSDVIPDLALANFDPEFCRMHMKEILTSFGEQLSSKFHALSTRNPDKVHSFMQNSANG